MTEYVTLDLFKRAVKINDKLLDEEILQVISDANNQINITLKPYAATVPLPPGDPYVEHARQAALEFAKHQWFEDNFQLDKAKYHFDIYEKKMEWLINEVKADRPPRTQSFLAAHDPRRDKLLLPGQRDTFILDVY